MPRKDLVSVVIPVFNGSSFLRESIESVLGQTFRPLELIVVDDGSTDQSGKIAQSFREATYFFQENQGVSVARNTGISAAKGTFIAFLDADDRWMPEKLSLQIRHLQDRPELGFTVTFQRIEVEDGIQIPTFLNQEIFERDHAAYVPSALLVRREVLEEVGGFDPEHHNDSEDIDWFARAKDAGIAMEVLPQTLLLRRLHNDNLSLQKPPDASQIMRALRKSVHRQKASES